MLLNSYECQETNFEYIRRRAFGANSGHDGQNSQVLGSTPRHLPHELEVPTVDPDEGNDSSARVKRIDPGCVDYEDAGSQPVAE